MPIGFKSSLSSLAGPPGFAPVWALSIFLSSCGAATAVVGRREDAADLSERGEGLVEAQAERDEVVDRGLRHSPPRSNGDVYSCEFCQCTVPRSTVPFPMAPPDVSLGRHSSS